MPCSLPDMFLYHKGKAELKRMEILGVISKVETPTLWCAGMVVVQGTSTVRICVDLRPLNENFLREVHLIPKVESTPSTTISSQSIFKTRCKQRLLAAHLRLRIQTLDYLLDTISEVMFQQSTIWNLQCS